METTHLKCRQCGAEFQLPSELTPEQKAEWVELSRTGGDLQLIEHLRRYYYVPLKFGKGIALHLSKRGNQCHRCGNEVETGISDCGRCRALNINW